MTPEQMRRAASLLDAAPSAYERVPGEHADLARLLREQAGATEEFHKLAVAQGEVQAELQRMFAPPPPEGGK